MIEVPYRLGVQQRMLPNYRAPFFELLGSACPRGLSLFAGEPRPEEAVEQQLSLQHAHLIRAKNLHILKGGLYFCWQRGLIGWLESWQPEVLILEANPRYLSSQRAMRWMHQRQRGLAGWGLGAPPASGFQDTVWRQFLSGFDVLIAYSQQGARQYARLGFDPQRIFIAPNAVAPRPSSPPPVKTRDFAGGKAVVLSVGRLQPRKKIDLLIRACAALPPAAQPDLWIVGDGPARTSLEALANSVYPAARFFGALYGSELAQVFARADLFVLPGTGGLAIQQAMSYALPVIVAEADGTQSNLVRPGNGWVVPPDDLDALCATLQEALADSERLRRMGVAAYEIVATEVNLENMVKVFARAIEAAADHAALRVINHRVHKEPKEF